MVISERINPSRDIFDGEDSCVEFAVGFERNKTKHSKLWVTGTIDKEVS